MNASLFSSFADRDRGDEPAGHDHRPLAQLDADCLRRHGCERRTCDIFPLLGESTLQFHAKHTGQSLKTGGESAENIEYKVSKMYY